MRKFAVLAETVLFSILLAGLYGILHDQITYSLAPEYFTKFKYAQFGFEPHWFGGDRQTVAIIGLLATWWVGLFIGSGLGLTATIYQDHRKMRKAARKAIVVTSCITVLAGIAGYLYGRHILTQTDVNWWLPDTLVDRNAFITVGSIHNFSYLGGLLGLAGGIFYLLWTNRQQKDMAVEKIRLVREEQFTTNRIA